MAAAQQHRSPAEAEDLSIERDLIPQVKEILVASDYQFTKWAISTDKKGRTLTITAMRSGFIQTTISDFGADDDDDAGREGEE